jgi:hypothetical protein
VAHRFGKWHTIWIDPGFVKLIAKRAGRVHRADGFAWKIDFRRSELEWRKNSAFRFNALNADC